MAVDNNKAVIKADVQTHWINLLNHKVSENYHSVLDRTLNDDEINAINTSLLPSVTDDYICLTGTTVNTQTIVDIVQGKYCDILLGKWFVLCRDEDYPSLPILNENGDKTALIPYKDIVLSNDYHASVVNFWPNIILYHRDGKTLVSGEYVTVTRSAGDITCPSDWKLRGTIEDPSSTITPNVMCIIGKKPNSENTVLLENVPTITYTFNEEPNKYTFNLTSTSSAQLVLISGDTETAPTHFLSWITIGTPYAYFKREKHTIALNGETDKTTYVYKFTKNFVEGYVSLIPKSIGTIISSVCLVATIAPNVDTNFQIENGLGTRYSLRMNAGETVSTTISWGQSNTNFTLVGYLPVNLYTDILVYDYKKSS